MQLNIIRAKKGNAYANKMRSVIPVDFDEESRIEL